jgi:hypothetical protein
MGMEHLFYCECDARSGCGLSCGRFFIKICFPLKSTYVHLQPRATIPAL